MNHNLETVPRLYRTARPGGDYAHSLRLLQEFKRRHPAVPTKSGLMVGLGETDEEILAVMRDLRAHGVDMVTIGQYLQPSPHHLPVERYVEPAAFARFEEQALKLGFRTPPSARWCARPTTRTGRRKKPGSKSRALAPPGRGARSSRAGRRSARARGRAGR